MNPESLDARIEAAFGPFVETLQKVVFFGVPLPGGLTLPLIILWVVAAALFFMVWLRPNPIRDIGPGWRTVTGRYARHRDPGDMTPFQATATELSGAIGLGNIAGVAVAVSAGGPGAIFWIIVYGFVAMGLKSAEGALGRRYRRVNADGSVSGGPMYYLRDGLAERGLPRLGKVLGLLYAGLMALMLFGPGNLFQANQMAAQVASLTGGEDSFVAANGWAVGVVLAAIVAAVVFGGVTSIARWTGRLTPLMGGLYAVAVLIVILVNLGRLPEAVAAILQGAFTGGGVAGGVIAVVIIGMQRSLFANAAGLGTTGMAHAASTSPRAGDEGVVAAWEPFFVSVVVCTLTGLAILVTGTHEREGLEGVQLTTEAFATVHPVFPVILTVVIVLFAFSTVLAFAYYGRKTAGYVFGNSPVAERVYDVVYLVFIIVGSAVSLQTVVDFSDAMLFTVTVPNLIGLYLLAGVARREIVPVRAQMRARTLPEVPVAERSTLLGKPRATTTTAAGRD